MNDISDIKHIFYINLESRPDRKIHVERQLELVSLKNPTRFDAIKMKNGAIGCSLSHLKCIELAKENNWPYVLICEDDIEFLNPELFVKQMNGFLTSIHQDWDVVLLAGNNKSTFQEVNSYCVKVNSCQTTTGYIVKNHYYDILSENIKSGIKKLVELPYNKNLYAIDKYWFELQMKDIWYLIIPLTVVQREDYSNIEKKRINYKKSMTSLIK
jgi:GR25 family glycosyltransferase involved in LPS biosynthesis